MILQLLKQLLILFLHFCIDIDYICIYYILIIYLTLQYKQKIFISINVTETNVYKKLLILFSHISECCEIHFLKE